MSPDISVPAAPPMPTNSRAPRPAADTGIGAATSLELEQLRAVLDVPVQGVARDQLRDNYSEPRAGHTHEAEDIIAPRGTPVLSATDGRVTKLHESVAGGHMIYAGDASDRWILMYGHLDRYADGVKEGMPLKRGQLIGYIGTTGNAPIATPHLHFAIARGTPSVKWWKGTPVNPYLLLK
jgi:murein DD-endopeptidase MepM/ murein hydrolase activator NlpD